MGATRLHGVPGRLIGGLSLLSLTLLAVFFLTLSFLPGHFFWFFIICAQGNTHAIDHDLLQVSKHSTFPKGLQDKYTHT